MKQIITDIQNRLLAEVPMLKYIDQDWGQMDFYNQPPVKFPCALIDIQNAVYTNIGNHAQQGTLTLAVRLFDLKLSNSSNGAPANQKEQARKIWQLIEDVNRAIHARQFLQHGYGLPIRQSMQRIKREDGTIHTELLYTIQFTDDTCVAEMQTAQAEAKITVGLRNK